MPDHGRDLALALFDRYRIERELGQGAWGLYPAGDTAAARAAALRAVALDSAFYEPYHLLVRIELDGGNLPAAREALTRATRAAGGDFWMRQTLEGLILARMGDTAGETDSMYTMFARAIDARDPDALWDLTSLPSLRPLHRTPRYQRLLQRMGLPEHLRR